MRLPKIALRYHGKHLDDVVVEPVRMFRAEQMDKDLWWFACYLHTGESVVFWMRGKNLRMEATETPSRYIDFDTGKPA